MKRLAVIAIAILALLVVLSACSVRIFMTQTETPNSLKCKFLYFAGTMKKIVPLNEGETLALYISSNLRMGRVNIRVTSPEGDEVLSLQLKKSTKTAEEVAAKSGGFYVIEISSGGASGSFEIKFEKISTQSVMAVAEGVES